jgi:nitrogen-specific signal transduction histidine kinase/CheY-like chemotaxis protein
MHVKKSHTSKDGTIIPCEVITNYLIVSGTEYKVAFVQDIRTRIELEEQIKHSEKMNAVGQLAGGIAHDFNNQLMGISGYAFLLRDKIRDNKLLNYVENIIKATEHSADLTKKLLAFSRKGKYITVVINAHEIIDECVMLLKPGLGKQVEIVVDTAADNPMVEGDTSSIQNAVLNIAINAKDAMNGQGKMTITTGNIIVDEGRRINKLSDGEYLAISISDTGTGISPDIREKIFEPFFSTKDSGQGTGLGLSATIGTIQAHSGTVVVESSPGEGSTFTIYLPSCHQEKAENYVSEKETVYGEGVIMLVDDEEVVRDVTRLMITKLGYNVVAFSDGSSCIDYYKKHGKKVAAVILDLVMPGMSGYDVFKELQKIDEKVQVLLFSGFSTNDEAQRALEMGAAGYLQKPARIEKLSKELIKIAGRSRFSEKETPKEDWSGQFPQDDAVNISKALKLVNDDRSLLKQIFRNFYKKYHSVPDTLESQAKRKNYADLYLNIHSLKTLFGNMGAEELFLFAEKLEKMIDAPEPEEIYSNRYFTEFIDQLKRFLLVVENWDGLQDVQENQYTEKKPTECDTNPQQAITEILELIQQYSPANTNRVKQIIDSTKWPEEVHKEISEINSLLEDYDFEDAGIKAKNIQTLIPKSI